MLIFSNLLLIGIHLLNEKHDCNVVNINSMKVNCANDNDWGDDHNAMNIKSGFGISLFWRTINITKFLIKVGLERS